MAITLSDGTNNITLHVDQDMDFEENPNIVEHVIPERSASIFQVMGRKSSTIPINGYTKLDADIDQLISWSRAGDVLTFTDTLHSSYASGISAIMMPGFISRRMPGRPQSFYRYAFVLKEYNQ